MVHSWLTINEVEKETEIPYATIRRYIRAHGHHFVVKKRENTYIFAKKSVPILLEVRKCYQEGKSGEQVENLLCDSNLKKIKSNSGIEPFATSNIAETLLQMVRDMNDLQEKQTQLLTMIQDIKKQQDYLHEEIENKERTTLRMIRDIKQQQNELYKEIEKREQAAVQTVLDTQKVKKRIASSVANKKWWCFWLR